RGISPGLLRQEPRTGVLPCCGVAEGQQDSRVVRGVHQGRLKPLPSSRERAYGAKRDQEDVEMSEQTLTGQIWVAVGPAGACGSIHRVEDGYTFRLLGEEGFRATFPNLEVAKRALVAALPPGSERPEFHEH